MQRAASVAVAPTSIAGDGPRAAAVPISELGVEIVARAHEGSNRFDIRLDPPELGRIHVRLDVDQNGNVASRLIVDRSETLDLLRRDAPALERALQSAGLKTGDSGLSFTLREHGGQGGSPLAGSQPATTKPVIEDTVAATAVISYGRRGGLGSGVDIRV
jgi:chemotaxis protein MotD